MRVTFFHDMPMKHVAKVNGKATATLVMKKWSDLSMDKQVELRKLRR